MRLTVYHLKNCDTCKKAIKALGAAGHEITLIDVRADGVEASELRRICETVGYEVALNTRSTTWRGLSDAEKSDIILQKAIELMGEHPTLIKRPVIVQEVGDGKNTELITVGWSPEIQANYI